METFKTIATLLETLIAVTGIILAVIFYVRQNKDKKLKALAKQICAYYAEEQEAIKWIAELTGDGNKKIQTELRNRAKENEFSNGERPDMTSNGAGKYL